MLVFRVYTLQETNLSHQTGRSKNHRLKSAKAAFWDMLVY